MALPQGFHDSPRIFTKLLKPALAHLRCSGHTLLIYIDDTMVHGNTFLKFQTAVTDACAIFDSLGFTIHPAKSVLEPTQCIKILGFQLESHKMLVSVTDNKALKIKSLCAGLIGKKSCTIRQLAEVIGHLVAAQPGVWTAPGFIKRLEIAKNSTLKKKRVNFDATVVITDVLHSDLEWWTVNAD